VTPRRGSLSNNPIELDVHFPGYYPHEPCEVYVAERPLYGGGDSSIGGSPEAYEIARRCLTQSCDVRDSTASEKTDPVVNRRSSSTNRHQSEFSSERKVFVDVLFPYAWLPIYGVKDVLDEVVERLERV